jgi:hypothetical protein
VANITELIEQARQAQQVAEGKQLEHPLQLEIPAWQEKEDDDARLS